MNWRDIMDYLIRNYDLTPEVAAGILGNVSVESGFDPEAENCNSGAFGLFQWLGLRKKVLEHFAEVHRLSVTDWKYQIDFAMHELDTDQSWGWPELLEATTAEEAAQIFCQRFERPGNDVSLERRMEQAKEMYDQWMAKS